MLFFITDSYSQEFEVTLKSPKNPRRSRDSNKKRSGLCDKVSSVIKTFAGVLSITNHNSTLEVEKVTDRKLKVI